MGSKGGWRDASAGAGREHRGTDMARHGTGQHGRTFVPRPDHAGRAAGVPQPTARLESGLGSTATALPEPWAPGSPHQEAPQRTRPVSHGSSLPRFRPSNVAYRMGAKNQLGARRPREEEDVQLAPRAPRACAAAAQMPLALASPSSQSRLLTWVLRMQAAPRQPAGSTQLHSKADVSRCSSPGQTRLPPAHTAPHPGVWQSLCLGAPAWGS